MKVFPWSICPARTQSGYRPGIVFSTGASSTMSCPNTVCLSTDSLNTTYLSTTCLNTARHHLAAGKGDRSIMSNVATQTIVYLALLFLGYGFKRLGIFKTEDAGFLKSVILYITMPAAAVNGLKALELQPSFLWCFLIGFATCSILMAVGMLASRKAGASDKLLFLFSFNSFNVGNFAIPFLNGLISDNGFAALCLFDISVAIFLYGIDYSVAESRKGQGGGFSPKLLLKKLFCSPITDAYLIMLLLAALHLRLPSPILKLAEVAGNANAFLAMLSIGILFELSLDKKSLRTLLKFFSLRYVTVLLIAGAVLLFVPFPPDIRQAVCVLLMAPVASVAPLLTVNAGGDGGSAAQANSLSILIGIVMMTVVYGII